MNGNGKTFTEIKGWKETRYLPRLGKIRLGKKGISKRTGKEHPIEIDYFHCPPEVQAIYGEKPKMIDIMFPSDDPTIIIPFCYKMYGANNRLKCKGNGEEALYWDIKTGELKEKKCPCEYLGKECDKRGHLMVILPTVSLGGVYQIDTGSGTNINRILDAIAYWQTMVGRCKGIPLTLERVPEKILSPEGKMNTHYLFRLGCKMKVEDLNKAIANTKQILAIDYKIEPPKEEGMLDDTPIEYIDEEEKPLQVEVVKRKNQSLPQKNPATTPEPTNGNQMTKTIHKLLAKLGWTDETCRDYLHEKYNMDSSENLSTEQQKEFIEYLSMEMNKKIRADKEKKITTSASTPQNLTEWQKKVENIPEDILKEALRATKIIARIDTLSDDQCKLIWNKSHQIVDEDKINT